VPFAALRIEGLQQGRFATFEVALGDSTTPTNTRRSLMRIHAGAAALCVTTVMSAVPLQAAEVEFCVVREGAPQCTIVLAETPTVAAEFATAELRRHVRQITGAELPVAREPVRVSGPRILVGESAATRELGLHGGEFADQEYVLRFLPDVLVLMGRDDRVTGTEPDQSRPKWIDGRFGAGLGYDGRDDGVSAPGCGFDDELGSLECWVRLSPEPQEREGTLLRLDGGGPWTYHILRRLARTSKVGYYTYDGKKVRAVVSEELAPGWRHVLATHDEGTGEATLFVDGVKQGSTPYVKTTCRGAPLSIGGFCRGERRVSNSLHGDLDEIRISRTVRSPERDAGGGPYATDDATTFLAHLDEGRGAPRLGDGYPGACALPALFGANGTLYAVYDFLERHCAVRWYAPGEIGTVLPARTGALTVRGSERRRQPAMRHRWFTGTPLYMPTSKDVIPARDVALWKLRVRLGGEAFWTCHSFGGYYGRFAKERPEFFAKGYKGKSPQMCYTAPGLAAQVAQDARDYFDGKGSQPGSTNRGPYFGIVPQDNSRYCQCAGCLAEMNAADAENKQFSRGLASDYVWGFVNKVAQDVRKTHPDKWISALAYARYAYYPAKVELAPNIVVQMCLHTRNWWAPFLARNDQRIFDEWVDKSAGKRPLYLWLYYNFPGWLAPRRHFKVFPGFFVRTAIRQLAMYHKAGIRGIFMEQSGEGGQSFLLDQLDIYVTLKLADDPELDGDALVEEFFTRYYGAAAAPMKALYFAIEDTYSTPANYPPEVRNSDQHFHQTEEMAWKWLGTEERMAGFGRLMDEARQAASNNVERERVALFDKGIWQYMVAGRNEWLAKAK